MTVFSVPDMTCGHCVKAITGAIAELDPQAVVQVDLANRQVRVDASVASDSALADALRDAGYESEVVHGTPALGAG